MLLKIFNIILRLLFLVYIVHVRVTEFYTICVNPHPNHGGSRILHMGAANLVGAPTPNVAMLQIFAIISERKTGILTNGLHFVKYFTVISLLLRWAM